MQLHAMGLQRLTGAHTRAHPCSNAHSARASSTHGRRQLRVQSVRLPWSWASTAAGGHRNTDGVDASAQRLRASGRPPTTPRWPRQAAMSCATFASLTGAWGSGGGGSGGGNGNSGGGDGGWHWGDGGAVPGSGGAPASNVLADVALNEAPDMVEEVILMDVGGMKCGGCVGHVKRVLEEQGDVREASVNLATETALVRVLVPRGSKPQDMKAIGDKLAQVVSAEGFKAALQH